MLYLLFHLVRVWVLLEDGDSDGGSDEMLKRWWLVFLATQKLAEVFPYLCGLLVD